MRLSLTRGDIARYELRGRAVTLLGIPFITLVFTRDRIELGSRTLKSWLTLYLIFPPGAPNRIPAVPCKHVYSGNLGSHDESIRYQSCRAHSPKVSIQNVFDPVNDIAAYPPLKLYRQVLEFATLPSTNASGIDVTLRLLGYHLVSTRCRISDAIVNLP